MTMSFKELLNRYKEGRASEEEIKIVEKELEKYESIEEYFTEGLSESFIQNNEMENEKVDESKNIRKLVNHRLSKVVISSVLIVVLLYVGIFYGLSNIMDKMYYDPTLSTQSQEQEYQRPDFYYDMQTYISLNMPGKVIRSFTSEESKGFGKYELSYSFKDLFSDEESRYFLDISKGKLTYAIGGIFSIKNRFSIWEGFEKIQFHFSEEDPNEKIESFNIYSEKKNEETLEYIEELNSLSYVSMSIVFEEDLTMEEFYKLTETCSDLDFKWVGVRTVEPGTKWSENQPMHLIGFNPNYNDEPSSNTQPDKEKYPQFNLELRELIKELSGPITSEDDYGKAVSKSYETHFKSRLSYISKREEFVELLDYNSYKIDFYNQSLEYIEEKGVKTYGILVFGTAEEFLNSIDKIPYDNLHINNVLPTKPNIYR
jgi:hypothetical protein